MCNMHIFYFVRAFLRNFFLLCFRYFLTFHNYFPPIIFIDAAITTTGVTSPKLHFHGNGGLFTAFWSLSPISFSVMNMFLFFGFGVDAYSLFCPIIFVSFILIIVSIS